MMKRLHVHVSVNDLEQSVRFYSTLFAAEPTVLKGDYAKWMLDDPRVNFAISIGCRPGGHEAGFSHLGIQAEDESDSLTKLREATERVGGSELAERAQPKPAPAEACCAPSCCPA
jgi:hypothetical protein